MPIVVSDLNDWTPATAPATAEACSEPVHALTAQWAANRTRFLAERTPGALPGQSVSVPLAPIENTSARWTFDSAQMQWDQTDVTSAGALVFPLALPCACQIVSVTARLLGSHSTAPADLPTVTVYRNPGTGAGASVVGSATHPGTDYDTATDVTAVVGDPYDPSDGSTWFVEVTGEASTNAATGLLLLDITVEVDPA